MSGLKDLVRRLTKVRGVPTARHVAERAVAPYLRADVHSLNLDHAGLVQRIEHIERTMQDTDARLSSQITGMAHAIDEIERHQPAVLNAIASVNGTTRLLRREFEAVAQLAGVGDRASTLMRGYEELCARLADVDERASVLMRRDEELCETVERLTAELERVRSTGVEAHHSLADVYGHIKRLEQEFRPHVETLSWLIGRVEMVRAEVMNELRYGGSAGAAAPGDVGAIEPKIVNPAAMRPADGELRVNLGCGHLPLPGFVNVDVRELPGVDVVATIESLPFEPASLAEIFSAHTLEHFPEEQLRRRLLPYWTSLLRPGGTFRAVVPDMEAMAKAYTTGRVPFDQWRSVAYGGQEYAGDFHFTGFSPRSLAKLFEDAGLVDARVIAEARPNGDSLECEVAAVRRSE